MTARKSPPVPWASSISSSSHDSATRDENDRGSAARIGAARGKARRRNVRASIRPRHLRVREPPASLDWLESRYTRLETRTSADGTESWLNWIVLLDDEAIGYVQATVEPPGLAWVAYEFGSDFWGRGLASLATRAMIEELHVRYGVHTLLAELVAANHRSVRLLERLGFEAAAPALARAHPVGSHERLMVKALSA